ncbi:MAG: thymidylate kinase [bacterium]|nr:thymidylate kinase [bacterium]
MKKHQLEGKLIVFEGIDGSGKSTQARMLLDRLEREGYEARHIHFPQYKTKAGGLVENYLEGRYGNADSYQASLLYSVDRFDAGFKMREWLKKGFVVVSDRYVASNIGHQGGKIKNKEKREEFFRWLYHMEYLLLKVPKPQKSFLLMMPPNIAHRLTLDLAKKVGKKLDIHEKSIVHLKNAEKAYVHFAKLFPKIFHIINSIDKMGKLLSPQSIHEEVWKNIFPQ